MRAIQEFPKLKFRIIRLKDRGFGIWKSDGYYHIGVYWVWMFQKLW